MKVISLQDAASRSAERAAAHRVATGTSVVGEEVEDVEARVGLDISALRRA